MADLRACSFVVICASAFAMAGCVFEPELSDKQLMRDYRFLGPEALTPTQQERAKQILGREQEENILQDQETEPLPSLSPMPAAAPSFAGFASPPSDRRSDCDDENSPFVRWIESVQAAAASGGACLNAKGTFLINSEGARKSRYCAQFYSGTEQAQSFQQAEEYDGVARHAQETIASSCS